MFDEREEQEKLTQKESIAKEIDNKIERIDEEIEVITVRQTEIINHIQKLENAIQHFSNLIEIEKDRDKRSRYYNIISHNIELLAKLYSVYREFEDVKNKYFKESNDLLISKIRIINIELEKIQKDIEDTNLLLSQMVDNFNNNQQNIKESDDLLKDQKYEI